MEKRRSCDADRRSLNKLHKGCPQGGGNPEITVNGATTTTLTIAAGGEAPVVTVISDTQWTLSFEPTDANAWITPSTQTGSGTTLLTLTVKSTTATTEREATIRLTPKDAISDQAATIIVHQIANVLPDPNAGELRALLKAMNPTATKTPVTAEIAAQSVTGIVISNSAAHNMVNDYLVAITDASGQPNTGLEVYATQFKDLSLTPGTIISAPLTGAQVQLDNGLLQLILSNEVTIATTSGTAPTPITVTLDKVLDYESQYVKIEKCQAIEGAYNVAWYVAGTGGNQGKVTFEINSGKRFTVLSGPNAIYGTQIVPSTSGCVQGIVSRSNADMQIVPQSADDISHLDQTRIAPDYQDVTIDNLDEAYYQVNGWIAAVHGKGILVADRTDQLNYVMGFFNGGNPYENRLDWTVKMKGYCADNFGLWQFTAPTLTLKAESAIDLGTPVQFDAAAIQAYTSAVKYQYVQLTGVVTITPKTDSTGKPYNEYNVAVDGLTDITVNLAYALDPYFNDIASGDTINVKGFAVGYDADTKTLSIMVRDVKKDPNQPTKITTNFRLESTFPNGFPTSAGNQTASALTFAFGGTNYVLNSSSVYYRANQSLFFGKTTNNIGTTAYIQLPAKPNKALEQVKLTMGGNGDSGIAIAIYDADGNQVSTDIYTTVTGNGTEYSHEFIVLGSDGAAYRVASVSPTDKDMQIAELVLTYQ